MEQQRKRVFLFGGAKGIGYWFARKILANKLDVYEVHICDVETPRILKPGSDFYWSRVEYKDGFIEGVPEDINEHDIIVLSVPIDKLDLLLTHLKKHIQGGPQVVNFSSVQHETNTMISATLPKVCAVYGLHLLFGPSVSHPAGNNAVVTDLDQQNQKEEVSDFLHFIEKSGLFLEYSSSQRHDEMMNILQVGVHFTFFGFARYLQEQGVDFSELLKYRTLPAGFFLSFMARALSQPKLTYANIQRQKGSAESRNLILDGFNLLDNELRNANSPNASETVLKNVATFFKNDDLLEGVAATQAAVQAYEQTSRETHDNVGSQTLVGITVAGNKEHARTIRIGYITREKRGSIEFDDRIRDLSSPSGSQKFALLRDKTSIDYYAKRGVSYSKKIYSLSKKRFKFLPRSYVEQWIKDNVTLAELSFPVKIEKFDPELLKKTEELLPNKIDALRSISFKNLYIKDDWEVTAVCFVHYSPIVEPEKIGLLISEAISSFIRTKYSASF